MQTGGFTFNAEIYLDRLTALRPPKLDQAVALALVDTAKAGIVKAAGLIARRTGLKSATVKARIYYDPVRVGEYQVTVRSSRRPIPLIEFPSVRQVAAGVRTGAWGRSQIIGSAFIATMPSGHRGVYRRTGRLHLSRRLCPSARHRLRRMDQAIGRRAAGHRALAPRLCRAHRVAPVAAEE